ncbi:MAG: lysophospholipid acyltransferase family protein [Paracoccaceae bacterium]
MAYSIQWLRSLFFIGQMYLMMLIMGIGFAPWALFSRKGCYFAMHLYCRWVRWTAGWMIGLKTEIRGEAPQDEVLLAAKHQSFLDIIMIFGAVSRGKFIMKKALIYAPILGQYALKIGCVPVDRGKRGAAIKQMTDDVKAGRQDPGQLIIYSQGTRVAPGVKKPYKIGSGILYEQLKQPCVPAATNVGVFWPRHGIYREPGLGVVEFLPRIEARKPLKEFMAELEETVEAASDKLVAEARLSIGKD